MSVVFQCGNSSSSGRQRPGDDGTNPRHSRLSAKTRIGPIAMRPGALLGDDGGTEAAVRSHPMDK